jgi:two-component system cell cycle sensor histidine kinase/response regulator CckA
MPTPLRVLIVEDFEEPAEALLRLLREGGYDVDYRRANSAAALAACLEEKTWDIAISGCSMNGFSGTQALSMILETGLDLPFLLFSDAISEEAAIEAIRMGAVDAIRRDNPAQLLSVIRRELQEAAVRRRQQQLEQRMRQLEKLEALGKLTGGIAHDFNNVVSAIMGWAELGARDVAPASDASESFEQIRQQAERAASLTRRLLTYARREMLEPCEVDLNSVVGETISLLQRVIGDNIEITLALAPDLGTTRADPSQIERVLINLCLNARDAMAEGGTLRIETRNVALNDASGSRHRDARPGAYVLVSVSDTGGGMEAETIERIFEPFFTTKPVGHGTGLGLTTALGVVTQYGGWIEVESQIGEGSTFHVHLPASGAGAVETPAQGAGKTVLVG